MIAKFQKISIKIQSYLSSIILDKIFGLLNITYLYSHLLKIFSPKQLNHIVKCLVRKEIIISSQNGFGDVLQSLLVAKSLTSKNWKVSLIIIYSTDNTNYLFQSLKRNKKEANYGDYIQNFIRTYAQEINYLGKHAVGTKASVYCHLPFFRLFLPYRKIINSGKEMFPKSTNQNYVSFYFRNNTKSIEQVLDFMYHSTQFEIFLFGEEIPEKYFSTKFSRITITTTLDFNSKINLFINSSFVVTGRGGFALLPLYNKTDSIIFFDEQGFDEISYGLWSSELWSHCGIPKPLTDSEIEIGLNYIKKKYVDSIIY